MNPHRTGAPGASRAAPPRPLWGHSGRRWDQRTEPGPERQVSRGAGSGEPAKDRRTFSIIYVTVGQSQFPTL